MANTYESYKDSGIAWIGEIPSEWKISHIKHYCEQIYAGGTPQSNNSAYWNGNIPWIPSGSCHDEVITCSPKFITEEGFENSSTKLIPQNTTVMAMTGATCANTGFVTFETCMNQSVTAYIEKKGTTYSKFLFYLLQAAREYILTKRTGGAQSGINVEDCKNLLVPHIPYTLQNSITSFLDSKCSEIDYLISLQEEMISELQAYKQSVITEAVTKGLDPNAKMKDSGEDWLGEIPEHWNLLPIRALFTKRNQKNNPIISTERLSLSIGVGITRYADKTTNLDRFKDDFTAYQLAYPEDIVLNSMNMIVGAVGKSAFMGCVSPVYYVITAKEGVSPDFYGYLLNCPKIREVYHSLGRGIYAIERGDGRVNTCRLKVPYYDFSIIKVPVPSYEDQIKIASYINNKISQIDSLITLKQEKIQELKDYKKSIIYEYVTGKKRV